MVNIMCIKMIRRSMVFLILLASVSLNAKELIKMEGMSVVGNKESPNLLYIVPWKSPKTPEMDELKMSSRLFDEALTQVDRDGLVREGVYWHVKQKISNRLK